MSDLARVLGDFDDTFPDRRWYLFGAQAVIAWAVPRQTADVDVTGRPRDVEDVREILKRSPGFDADAARGLLIELEALTERSDLTPLLERLLVARA